MPQGGPLPRGCICILTMGCPVDMIRYHNLRDIFQTLDMHALSDGSQLLWRALVDFDFLVEALHACGRHHAPSGMSCGSGHRLTLRRGYRGAHRRSPCEDKALCGGLPNYFGESVQRSKQASVLLLMTSVHMLLITIADPRLSFWGPGMDLPYHLRTLIGLLLLYKGLRRNREH